MINHTHPPTVPIQTVESNAWHTFFMVGVGIVLFYFIVIRPERERYKRQQAVQNTMKVGDSAIVNGIFVEVVALKEDRVTVKTCDGSQFEVLRSSIGPALTS